MKMWKPVSLCWHCKKFIECERMIETERSITECEDYEREDK